ncbi:MAG: GDP-mannose 4,6-dehydratase, partial [Candidatus Eremiobacteraeota bacterium]|nr:GDP-mannose 4,6-dehydratase [Candidatus Eremiobacteraeota bacterium]
MRWLVTGGLGFIGSHFIRLALRRHPALQIVNLDALTYAGNPANLRDVEGDPRYRLIAGDVCDAAAVRGALAEGAGAILNFAAETHVDRSILDPQAFLRTDALGTLVLLEAAREFGVPRFLQVSTDEVYGDV